VIEDATKIKVTLKSGETYEAKLIGSDSDNDTAIIKIEKSGLTAAVMGDSDALKVGQTAIAIGNPLGQLGGTVTTGIISALDREIDLGDTVMNLLQTNAAINPGNSGGALFNAGLVLYDMTNGYINIFKDPYMRKAGEFAVRAVISENQVINFADASAGAMPQPIAVYQWGQLCGSPEMQNYGAWKLGGKLTESRLNDYLCYRSLRFLTQERIPSTKYVPVKYFIFEKLGIAGSRQFTDLNKGLYLSLKGGSNAEGHNHNDVGSFVICKDNKQLCV
jgi:hypothetical protein